MSRILLTDADMYAYRCAASAQKNIFRVTYRERGWGEQRVFTSKTDLNNFVSTLPDPEELSVEATVEEAPEEHIYQNIKTSMDALGSLGTIVPFLTSTDKSNFRVAMATVLPYKGNRSVFAKPRGLELAHEFLVKNYGAIVVFGQEADDRIAQEATRLGVGNFTIVSNDKDFDQIAGHHYNPQQKREYEVSEREAHHHFYSQVLTGDAADNVPGILGVGLARARTILKDLTKPRAMWSACKKAYFDKAPDLYPHIVEIANLLYLRREEGVPWKEPSE